MKKFLVVLGFFSLVVGSAIRGQDKPAPAPDGSMHHQVVRPDAIKWGAPPPGLPAGSEFAVLVGDPGKPGPFVIRAKMPDGYKVPPHWHSADENITVLQGTLMVGTGEKFDPSAMEDLPAGSFFHMPGTMLHFVMAKGETIIQVHGVGPFSITYVNPADDPRKTGDNK